MSQDTGITMPTETGSSRKLETFGGLFSYETDEQVEAAENGVTFIMVPEWGDATQNNVVNPEHVFEGSFEQLFEFLNSIKPSSRVKEAVPMLIPGIFDDVNYTQAMQKVKQHDGTTLKVGKFSVGGTPEIRRAAENLRYITMLSADFDGGMTIEQAEEIFAGFSYILYTSYNHLADGKTHKFRMLFEIIEALTPAELVERRDAFAELFGDADPSTTDLARGFFIPCTNLTNDVEGVLKISKGQKIDALSLPVNVAPAYGGGSSFTAMNTDDMTDEERVEIIEYLTNSGFESRKDWLKMITALKGLQFSISEVIGISANNPNHMTTTTGIKTGDMCRDAYDSCDTWDAEMCIAVISKIVRVSGQTGFRKNSVPTIKWRLDSNAAKYQELMERVIDAGDSEIDALQAEYDRILNFIHADKQRLADKGVTL